MPDSISARSKLLILGTGTFAMEAADLVDDIGGWDIVGFVASLPPYQPGDTILGLPVYWVDELERFDNSHHAVCALVTTKRWKFIEQVTAFGIPFATIIHPTARVSRRATVGEGSVISAGVQVSTHTHIGRHVVINRGALIGHHDTIHDYVTISPGANIAGSVTIGTRTYVGMGALIVEKRTIGSQVVVGAGALVTRDVPDRVRVLGLPARVVEENIEGM